jgi:hypothetical protein
MNSKMAIEFAQKFLEHWYTMSTKNSCSIVTNVTLIQAIASAGMACHNNAVYVWEFTLSYHLTSTPDQDANISHFHNNVKSLT